MKTIYKKKNNIIFIIVLFHIQSCAFLSAQDIHFSQFNETPQLLNPGASGVYDGNIRAIVNYKNQWKAMGNLFNTTAASVDGHLLNKNKHVANIGTGLNFFSDKAGDSKFGLTQVNLCVSGIVPILKKSYLSLGLSVGGAQHKANLSSLSWGNQYDGKGFDPTINNHETIQLNSFYYFDLSAGLFYEYAGAKTKLERNQERRFTLGVAYFHLNRPKKKYYYESDKLYGKLVCFANGCFDLKDSPLSIVPSVVFYLQGPSIELTAGSALRYRIKNGTKITGFFYESGISIGLHYRVKDAIIPQVYFEMKNFAIGFSYDINTSSYRNTSHYIGGPEISLKYNFKNEDILRQKKK